MTEFIVLNDSVRTVSMKRVTRKRKEKEEAEEKKMNQHCCY